MGDWTPTGRIRYRPQKLFGKSGVVLVAQIEIRGIETYCVGGVIDSEWANRWRDARVEDLPALTRPPESP